MTQLINSNVQTMSSKDLLDLINEARISFGENPVRLNDFNNRVQKEIDDYYEVVVVKNPNNTESVVYMLNEDQCLLVSMRESKSVRKNVLEKLRSLQNRLPDFTNPVEAARAWANEVEAKQIAQKQLELAAPKIEFVEKYVESVGNKGFREVAKLLKIKEPKFRDFLTDNKIMYRLNGALMGYANHIDAGRFHVSTGLSKSGHAFNQCLFTPKGVEWIAAELAKESVRGK